MHRKLPALTADNRAFWQGGEQGRLFMHWCEDCTSYFHPPGPVCPKCASLSVRPKEVSNVEEPVEQIYIGMPLRVVFEQQEDVWIPLFIKD